MTEYAYSLDGEVYDGPFEAIEDAHQDARQYIAEYEPDLKTYWIAEVVPAEKHLDAPMLGDRIANMINLELCNVTNGDQAPVYVVWEDSRRLGQMVIDFLRNSGSFERFGIRDAKEYRVGGQDNE
jgi:hypothetical protein